MKNPFLVLVKPSKFFESMPKEGGWLRPVLEVAGWSFAGAAIVLGWEAIGLGPFSTYGGVPAAAWGLLWGPILGIPTSFIWAAVLHGLCRLIGGTASFQASYRIVAAMAVISPISAALGPIGLSFILIQAWVLVMSVAGAVRVHRTRPAPAWAAFGLLTAFALASGWLEHKYAPQSVEHAGLKTPMPDEGSLTPEDREALEKQDPEAASHSIGGRDPKKP
jgi:hypothetical protein